MFISESPPGQLEPKPAGDPEGPVHYTPQNCPGGGRENQVFAQPSCPSLAEVNSVALAWPCTRGPGAPLRPEALWEQG